MPLSPYSTYTDTVTQLGYSRLNEMVQTSYSNCESFFLYVMRSTNKYILPF